MLCSLSFHSDETYFYLLPRLLNFWKPDILPRIINFYDVLFCQPRVEVTSYFVYKVMRLTFHDRINTQLNYRIAVAQVETRRITKPQRTFFFRFESHWLLFFIHFFLFVYFFFWGGGGGEGRGMEVWFYYSLHVFFFFLFLIIIIFFIFIPLTCLRNIYKNFWNNTSYCKFGNTCEYER